MDFRKLIKKEMRKKKMTTPKLARLCELNQETIYRYLRGGSEITSANLTKIFEVLELKFTSN